MPLHEKFASVHPDKTLQTDYVKRYNIKICVGFDCYHSDAKFKVL